MNEYKQNRSRYVLVEIGVLISFKNSSNSSFEFEVNSYSDRSLDSDDYLIKY